MKTLIYLIIYSLRILGIIRNATYNFVSFEMKYTTDR